MISQTASEPRPTILATVKGIFLSGQATFPIEAGVCSAILQQINHAINQEYFGNSITDLCLIELYELQDALGAYCPTVDAGVMMYGREWSTFLRFIEEQEATLDQWPTVILLAPNKVEFRAALRWLAMRIHLLLDKVNVWAERPTMGIG